MRLTYPKSFLSLLLIGFTIVAAPLLFALFSNAVAFERLAALSEQAVLSAVKVTQASRALTVNINALERSARQYAVAGEGTFLEAYRANRAAFQASLKQLEEMPLSDDQRAEATAISKQEETVHQTLMKSHPTAELSMRLAADFGDIADRGLALVRIGDQVIDEGIEQLRTQAVKSRNRVFWLMIAMIPTAVLLIASFTFLIAKPISQVTSSIRSLGEGQFAKPITIEGPGDMVRLGEQLDWLRERLISLEAQKTRFLQHLSHELKTPLTALREGSDLLSSGVVGNLNAEQREIALILQENSIELRKLIEGLLNYSAVHASQAYLDAKIVQLRDVVRRVINDRKLAIVAKAIRVELNCENVTAYCDEEKIRVLLDNLLSNAVKFSPERGLISIKLYKDHANAVLEVSDEGPGIPASERDKVFEAFYRGTDSPLAAIKGSGLGLSIVKEYVQLHKGEVEILEGPGAHFRIRFPRKRDLEEAA
ncbi:sensor histidine kinase [Usitatibacter palustris]|uniref:histidine kinase n=1 Tax=Usitatibacter palustris TaxID=2732487 RepID=A0A6M4H6W5_9PROT|nr:ATP-binding protein [Usitatibacter palustris]QJR14413.1 Sensor histidine kinase GlrK [Usitatibacter palustris]